MKLAEFFISLGVDADQKKLESFTDGVLNLDKTLKGLKVLAVSAAIKVFTDQTINAAVAVQNFNNQTGELSSKLQQWQIAGELSDISLSADQITASISALQQNLTQIRLGGGNVAPFQLLGINVMGKGAFEVLENLRNAIRGLDNATAVNMIQQTGLSPNFINVLRLSREEFEKLFGEKTVLTTEKRNDVIALGTAFTGLKISMVAVKDQIVAAFAPAFTYITNILINFADKLSWAIDNFTYLKEAIYVLVGAFGALLLKTYPLVRIGTILFAVFDDLFTLLKGGDSILGRIGNAMVELGNKVKEFLLKPFNEIKGIIDEIRNTFGENGIFGFGGTKKEDLVNGILPKGGSSAQMLNNNVNNIFNINSTADANTLAKSIADQQQRIISYSLQELNNGTVT